MMTGLFYARPCNVKIPFLLSMTALTGDHGQVRGFRAAS
jgi:hypothetical protein